jgi:hypothetical protein
MIKPKAAAIATAIVFFISFIVTIFSLHLIFYFSSKTYGSLYNLLFV